MTIGGTMLRLGSARYQVADGFGEIEGGLDETGAMVLEGELRTFVSGAVSRFRGTWTELENGLVNQRFEIADPESGAWTVWFDGLYSRRD